jgi:hypothetical protein
MNHEALRELTGAYALGALSGEEKRALEAHLASCAECAEEVRAFGDVARGLNDAVPQIDPPASLRGRVLAHVESLAAKSAAPSAVPQARSGQRFSGTPWLALAASLAAAVLGFYALSLRDRVQALQGELVEARQRAATADRADDPAARRESPAHVGHRPRSGRRRFQAAGSGPGQRGVRPRVRQPFARRGLRRAEPAATGSRKDLSALGYP